MSVIVEPAQQGQDAPPRHLAVSGKTVDGTNPLPITGSLSITSALLVESIWTDDTGAFFVRIDNGTTISWATIAGAASSAPSTGARPAAGASITSDRSPYVAITAATGYSVGDLIDHYITIDPTTGAVLGSFWINATTGAKLAGAPTSANIKAVGPPTASTGAGAVDATTARVTMASDDPLIARTMLTDRTAFVVVTAGASYSVGDLVNHVITLNPVTGAFVASYWLNATTGAIISAPGATDVQPVGGVIPTLSLGDLTRVTFSFTAVAAAENVLLAALGVNLRARVYRFHFTVSAATDIDIYDATAGEGSPALIDPYTFGGPGGWGEAIDGRSWWTTQVNKSLVLKSSAAVKVHGVLFYKSTV